MSVKVPRSFRLLEELEKAEKQGLSDPSLTLGVANQDDINMDQWNGTIMGPPGTKFADLFFQIQFYCGKDYPNSPPNVRFVTCINLEQVKNDGTVLNTLDIIRNWNSSNNMEQILVSLKNAMLHPNNRNRIQPPEGKNYF
eukprot:TRINITY_DN1387_c0_g1_i1.p1 TRINITY_DN1387_c0_g1~~TRINITY_DN1387_c0_g1_i1.p1  ORF type:complete len:140 (+),score=36.82 TRINITY_DN1387_c0_g1_i1:41-460(+)